MQKAAMAVARCLGTHYTDGVESMEIHTPKPDAEGLPYIEGRRVPIDLRIGGLAFRAGLRATEKNPVVWICPDLEDAAGRKTRLADILTRAQIGKNQKLILLVNGYEITVALLMDVPVLHPT